MNIIFSRKGFDSASGGIPSPILPDGTLLSLPIPYPFGPHRFAELRGPHDTSYGALLRQLGWRHRRHGRAWRSGSPVCHLDPDLRPNTIERPSGWRPIFGQVGIGQSQLTPYDIRVGDLFLFFGLFRRAEWQQRKLRFVADARPLHVLYGWLRVGEILTANTHAVRDRIVKKYPWVTGHPHVEDMDSWQQRIGPMGPNRLYLSADAANGAGILRLAQDTTLSAPGLSASRWKLFDWCGNRRNSAFSRCATAASWRDHEPQPYFDTHVGRWQELVVPVDTYPGAQAWAENLIERFGTSTVPFRKG